MTEAFVPTRPRLKSPHAPFASAKRISSTGNFDWVELFEGESSFGCFKVPVLSAFHSLVYDGIPQKFPKLRCGFIEVGAQWVPYMCIEMGRRFERDNIKREPGTFRQQ